MARTTITLMFLVLLSVCVTALGQSEPNEPNEVETTADVNETKTADVNETKTAEKQKDDAKKTTEAPVVEMSQELKEAYKQLEKTGNEEQRKWLGPDVEERLALARAVHKQIEAELMLLSKIAAGEQAKNTISAIDKILEKRKKTLEQIIDKAKREKEKKQSQQREKRQTRPRMSREERRRMAEEKHRTPRTRRQEMPFE